VVLRKFIRKPGKCVHPAEYWVVCYISNLMADVLLKLSAVTIILVEKEGSLVISLIPGALLDSGPQKHSLTTISLSGIV